MIAQRKVSDIRLISKLPLRGNIVSFGA